MLHVENSASRLFRSSDTEFRCSLASIGVTLGRSGYAPARLSNLSSEELVGTWAEGIGHTPMCGIFGYVGDQIELGSQVLKALKTLEYRGYDSWGVALGVNGRIDVEKNVGKISGSSVCMPDSDIGFGHTRWATHGKVTEPNAHPHLSCDGRLAVIHNGIVENFRELRETLLKEGHTFRSDTDSEVIAHMLEAELPHHNGDLVATLATVFPRLDGLNAVIAMDVRSRELVATKNVSPLIAGLGEQGAVIASDAMALLGHADKVVYLEDHHLVRLSHQGLSLYDRSTLTPIALPLTELSQDEGGRDLGAYDHFMAKEMAEQPDVLEQLVREKMDSINDLAAAIGAAQGTFLVGCGTASYAALTGSYLFSRIAKHHINFVVGSEFKYHDHFITPRSLVIALSQSGETADVIEAMMTARSKGARLGAIVNVERSTLDRMVDTRVPLGAGPEQCVLSTKAYTAKVAALLLAAHVVAGSPERGKDEVLRAADGLRTMLTQDWISRVQEIAASVQDNEHLFVIGRGLAYATALEAALKIKEVSYVHAEGFAGGELKHGVIALIAAGTPCVVYAPDDETRADILSGAMELKSRGGYIIGIGPQHDPCFDAYLSVPDVGHAAPIVNALPAQMLGYQLALLRGNDPDKPRNLAKSVTVK